MTVVTFQKKMQPSGGSLLFWGDASTKDVTALMSRHLVGGLRHSSRLCTQEQLVLNEAETNQDVSLVEF